MARQSSSSPSVTEMGFKRQIYNEWVSQNYERLYQKAEERNQKYARLMLNNMPTDPSKSSKLVPPMIQETDMETNYVKVL